MIPILPIVGCLPLAIATALAFRARACGKEIAKGYDVPPKHMFAVLSPKVGVMQGVLFLFHDRVELVDTGGKVVRALPLENGEIPFRVDRGFSWGITFFPDAPKNERCKVGSFFPAKIERALVGRSAKSQRRRKAGQRKRRSVARA